MAHERGAERVAGMTKSLKKYEWLISHAERLLDDVTDPTQRDLIFKEELDICIQMAELLPEKINRAHYLKQQF